MCSMQITLLVLVSLVIYVNCSCPTIISRQEWGASPPKSKQNLRVNPPPYVVIHHTDTPACTSLTTCKTRVKNIQHHHLNTKHWEDIGYNFLIGGDGNVYEGRGWGIHGSHVPKYNGRSIGISVIGDFESVKPSSTQLNTLKQLINCGKENGKIKGEYHLIGHRQGSTTDCPGNQLYNEIKTWPNYDPRPN